MTNNFSWNLGGDYICHYGKGHDDNPPGRGSGRYGWGTGTKNHKPRPKTLKGYVDNYVAERTKQFRNQYGYVPVEKFKEYKAERDRLIEEAKQSEGYFKLEARLKAREVASEPTTFSSVQDLSNYMKKNISYDDTTHPLKTTEQLLNDKSGNCHDQTLYELEILKEMGRNPRAMFLIEVDDSGQGGVTHSFAYYKEGKKIRYFENAWGGHEGIKEFDKIKDIQEYFLDAHSKGEFGLDKDRFTNVYFGDFRGQPGDSLQDIVNKSLD